MPCYAMQCYAMLCYAMLCYAMLCYAMLCCCLLACLLLLLSRYLLQPLQQYNVTDVPRGTSIKEWLLCRCYGRVAFPHCCIVVLYYCIVCNVLYSLCCIRIVALIVLLRQAFMFRVLGSSLHWYSFFCLLLCGETTAGPQ